MIVNDAQCEITAHHTGGEYHATGDTVVAVETETVDTYIDLVPSFNMSSYNYMERMWAAGKLQLLRCSVPFRYQTNT